MAKPNLLNSVQLTKPSSNVFDLSHDVKLSMRMGELVPTLCMEVVPGDNINLGAESLFRLAPMVAPMMHRVDVSHHYFFVPYRILWRDWEEFINSVNNPLVAPIFPQTALTNPSDYGRLMDYLSVPTPPATGMQPETISALPALAYHMIWQEYYRDQNLQTGELIDFPWNPDDFTVVRPDGAAWVMRHRCWEHDYFTSALPFSQKGPTVSIPVGGFNDVPVNWRPTGTNTSVDWASHSRPDGFAFNLGIEGQNPIDLPTTDSELYASTSQLFASQATINDLRLAEQLQKFLERDARGGTRLTEKILAHFGVRSSDSRLQRPEYITGTKSPIVVSEVLNTTGTNDAPQGTMAGHGVGVNGGKYGHYRSEEFGFIMCITSVMPKTAYQQGFPKFFKKFNPTDYFWPLFANLGEQPITNGEIYAYTATTDELFGYTPRYAEYKFLNSRVCGEFKTSLNFWHMGRIFDNPPALNDEFITCVPTKRVFAVEDPAEDELFAQIYHRIAAYRPMPKFGIPTL